LYLNETPIKTNKLSDSKYLKHIKIFRDGKILYESEITNELIQNLKQNSYVTIE